MSENELVVGCQKNNREAQRKLFEAYAGKLKVVCVRYMKNTDDADDLLMEAFIKIYDKIGTFRNDGGSIEGWMRRLVVNMAITKLAKNKKDLLAYADDVENCQKLSEVPIDSMTAQELMKVIESLPTGYRTVFNMYAIDGYTHKEIAEALKIDEVTSRSQLNRARNHIKKKYNVLYK